jgi:WD repeat-containing protein mio
MVATKAVYGVCVDPHNDYQIGSRVDNTIALWDRRMFDKPLLTLVQNKAVTKILWCPTRHNLLGSLQRDSTVLHLADLRGLGSEEEIASGMDGGGDPPAALERSVAPGSSHTITSFSWHPTDSNRLLTISMPGTITDYTVCERITLNWGSGSGQFVWSYGNTTLKMLTDSSTGLLDDISVKIKRRATTDYGLKAELWQNGDLTEDEQLKKLWYWLYISKSLVEDGMRIINYKLESNLKMN